MNSLPTSVIFDFDYTLADSSRGACACIDHALRSLGLPPVAASEAVRTIGLSLPQTFARLAPTADPRLAPDFTRLFLERAAEVMVDLTEIYDSAPATIRDLRKAGLDLAIVSTKYRLRIETILTRDGLQGDFSVIVGGEDVAAHKPDPAGLLKALRRLACGPSSAVYVGDSTIDAETARRAATPFIATLTGTTPEAAFSTYPVEAFIEDLDQLPELLH